MKHISNGFYIYYLPSTGAAERFVSGTNVFLRVDLQWPVVRYWSGRYVKP